MHIPYLQHFFLRLRCWAARIWRIKSRKRIGVGIRTLSTASLMTCLMVAILKAGLNPCSEAFIVVHKQWRQTQVFQATSTVKIKHNTTKNILCAHGRPRITFQTIPSPKLTSLCDISLSACNQQRTTGNTRTKHSQNGQRCQVGRRSSNTFEYISNIY